MTQARHPVTGRWLAHDCEIDCQDYCAGLCFGVDLADPLPPPDPATRWPCNEHPAALARCTPWVQRAHLNLAARHKGSV